MNSLKHFQKSFHANKMSTPKPVHIAMNDTVDIKYKGQYELLKKYVLQISPELGDREFLLYWEVVMKLI